MVDKKGGENVNTIAVASMLKPFFGPTGTLFLTVEMKDHEGKVVGKNEVPLNSKAGHELLLATVAEQLKGQKWDRDKQGLVGVIKGMARKKPIRTPTHFDPDDPDCRQDEGTDESQTATLPPLPDDIDFLLTERGVMARFKEPDGRVFPAKDPVVKAALYDHLLQWKRGKHPKTWEEDSYLKRCIAKAIRESRGQADFKEDQLDRETGVLALLAMMVEREKNHKGPFVGNQTALRTELEAVCKPDDLDVKGLPTVRDFKQYFLVDRAQMIRENNL